MKKSLIQGLNEKDMKAVLATLSLNDFYFPTLMPLRFTPFLTWKALQADQGIPVAADVVAYDAKAPRKSRKIVERLQGDIPKIEIARVKKESDLNEYAQLKLYAGSEEGAQALVNWIYDDVEFCFTGVNARIEWLALQALSLGKVSLSKSNNNGIVTETAIDFQVPSASKGGVSVVWSAANTATSKPITNIKAICATAKKAGNPIRYILMNQDCFDAMAISAEVMKYCAAWVIQASETTQIPSLNSVNAAFTANNLPKVVIIESYVAIEAADGTTTTVNPWTDGVVTFVPDIVVGNTFHAPLADEQVTDSSAVKTKRGHILIKKFSEEDPIAEVTKGMANAFPVWASATKSYLLYTLGASWSL
jgi:hypothetical protein